MATRDNAMDEILASVAQADDARRWGRILTPDEWNKVYDTTHAILADKVQVPFPKLDEALTVALAKIRIFTPPPAPETEDNACTSLSVMANPLAAPGEDEEELVMERDLGTWQQCGDEAGHEGGHDNGEWCWTDEDLGTIAHRDPKAGA